ncbi:hypothetical protein LTS18_002239, partial [Coniosporium uncinatum]
MPDQPEPALFPRESGADAFAQEAVVEPEPEEFAFEPSKKGKKKGKKGKSTDTSALPTPRERSLERSVSRPGPQPPELQDASEAAEPDVEEFTAIQDASRSPKEPSEPHQPATDDAVQLEQTTSTTQDDKARDGEVPSYEPASSAEQVQAVVEPPEPPLSGQGSHDADPDELWQDRLGDRELFTQAEAEILESGVDKTGKGPSASELTAPHGGNDDRPTDTAPPTESVSEEPQQNLRPNLQQAESMFTEATNRSDQQSQGSARETEPGHLGSQRAQAPASPEVDEHFAEARQIAEAGTQTATIQQGEDDFVDSD